MDDNYSFHDVDSGESPEEAAKYLDLISSEAQIQAYKQASLARLNVQEGEWVLEIGCGTGEDLQALADAVGESGSVTGLELSEELLGVARERMAVTPNVELVQGTATQLPFAEDSFDAVRIDRVLIHIEDPESVLCEVMRVLRPGGRLAVTEGDWDTLTLSSTDRETTRTLLHFACDYLPNGWIGRQLSGLFRRTGFVNLDIGTSSIWFDNFDTPDKLWMLSLMVQGAIALSVIPDETGTQWLAELKEQDAAGEFFCSLTGVGICGQKPLAK